MQVREIRSLTGLRGVAALLVVLYHADINFGPLLGRAVRHGYLAVDLFFLLSGYVMSLSYGSMFLTWHNWASYRRFLLLRFGRIYPLYFVVTIICILLYGTLLTHGGVRLAFTNLLLVQSWGFDQSIVGPGWSISTEAAAYLLFPVLAALCLHRTKMTAWIWALLCLVSVCVIAFLPLSALNQPTRNGMLDSYGVTIFPLWRCLAEFSLGMLVWRAAQSPHIQAIASRPFAGDALAIILLLTLLIRQADILIVVLFALMIPLLAAGTSQTAKLLGWGPFHWLGVISYSLYMVHYQVFAAFQPRFLNLLGVLHVPRLVSIANSLLIPPIILLAYVTFRFIERPGRLFVRHLTTAKAPTLDVDHAAMSPVNGVPIDDPV